MRLDPCLSIFLSTGDSKVVSKLIYFTVTKLNIAYVVGLVSQFIHKPIEVHWKAALRILTYIKGSPGK